MERTESNAQHPGFRIVFIGAGFSRSAGLPLGAELFPLIKQQIELSDGKDTAFHRDLAYYRQYRDSCQRSSRDPVDLEEFLSFLDIEHFLGLRGSDHLSREGNQSQLRIRKAIGEVIYLKTPAADKLPDVYYRFAENLTFNDTVITLNYDILLERALEHIGKPYRLFPTRYKKIGRFSNEVDPDCHEVVVLKLHGSVDWFHDGEYLGLKAVLTEQGATRIRTTTMFDEPERYGLKPILDGLVDPDDPLCHIFKCHKIDNFYLPSAKVSTPYIVSPSHVKFVYSSGLSSFWFGMGQSGGWSLGIGVIGFSLPLHDEYIRIPLYQIINNYQEMFWGEDMATSRPLVKDKVRIVDLQTSDLAASDFKARYSFADPAKTEYYLKGFDEEAVNFIFKYKCGH